MGVAFLVCAPVGSLAAGRVLDLEGGAREPSRPGVRSTCLLSLSLSLSLSLPTCLHLSFSRESLKLHVRRQHISIWLSLLSVWHQLSARKLYSEGRGSWRAEK